MPVRIFRSQIRRKKEKDILELADEINQFERELEEHGMQIRNINFSAAIDTVGDEFAYSIVLYGSRT
jgi:hypothetical protein